jgi:peptidoglycan/LPS O-acetylase OafA/YrhL
MPELDTLRGVAIISVVFFHGFTPYEMAGFSGYARAFLFATRWGFLGVNLFFVLSGFLITGILLDSKAKPRYYQRFYIRRALRILPAYCLLLLLLLLLPRLGLVGRHVSWSFVGLSFIYLSNFTNFFGVPMQYGPLWSLAVEEHFYLLWPAGVRNLSRKWLACGALAVLVASPVLRGIMFSHGHTAEGWYTPLVADGLASGALLAVLCRTLLSERRAMKRFAAFCLVASAVTMGLGSRAGLFSPTSLLGASLRRTLFSVLFTGMLSAALLLGTSRWARVVHRPVLQFFGEISYGLYLVHTLVFDLTDRFAMRFAPRIARLAAQGYFPMMVIRFVLAGGAATLLAFLSRRYFEERFLRLKDRWGAPTPESVPVSHELLPSAEQVA